MSDYSGALITGNGLFMNYLHPVTDCARRHCWVHNPSRHPLRDAPVYWMGPGEIYRACPHRPEDAPHSSYEGLHADPDHLDYLQGPSKHEGWQGRFPHGGCCGARCCRSGRRREGAPDE